MTEPSRLVRWLIIIVLSAATGAMVAVSLRANYLFGFGFGQTPEKAQVFGWANVAADVWKISGLIVITSLWRARQRRFALMLVPVWVLCLLWGLGGAIGVYAQDRSTLTGSREAKAATYRQTERELDEIDGKLGALGTARAVSQIDAAIATILAGPVMAGERVLGTVGKVSASCTKEVRATMAACREIASLREERAAAEEVARLEVRKTELRDFLARLRDDGGALPADPVSELFAWLSRGRFQVRDIAFSFPLVFAFLIEIVSAFGPAGIVAYAEATRRADVVPRRDMASSGELVPAAACLGEHGRVVTWMAERTEPTASTSAIAIDALHADYEVWCMGKSVVAAPLDIFGDEFDQVRNVPELAGKIRKFGSRYYGIRLCDVGVANAQPKRRLRSSR